MTSRPSAGRITLLATLFTALGPITMSMYAPIMPSLARGLSTSVAMVQLTLTLYLVAFAAAQLVHGPLSDRFGRKPILLVGIAIHVVGSLAAMLAHSIGLLGLARFVQAIGVCAGPVVARAVVRDLFEGIEAARIMAAIGMAIAAAPAIGPVLGGHLDVWFDWRAVFLFQAAAGVAIGLVAWLVLVESNSRPDPQAFDLRPMARNFAMLARSRTFLGYAGLNACQLGGLFTFLAAAPFVFIDVIGLSPEIYGWTMLFTVTAYFVGSWLARRGVGRHGVARLVLRGALCSTFGGLSLFAVVAAGLVTVPTLIPPMMLITLGIGMSMPGAMTGALQPFPRIAGTASSLLGFFQMGLGAVGTVVASLFGAHVAWALAIVPLCLSLSGLVVFWGLIHGRHVSGRPA